MKKDIALIHFSPLEYYPPVTNLINYISENSYNIKSLTVFSTHNNKSRLEFSNKCAKILRVKLSNVKSNRLIRFFRYVYFQLFVIIKLIYLKPDKILYYESISSFPAYIYHSFFNNKVKIFIHYHEYFSNDHYTNVSMKIEKYFHKLEKNYIYQNAVWISHTNKQRLTLFKSDYPILNDKILKMLPNYPPSNWQNYIVNYNNKPIKVIYIGSLSFESTYIKEFCNWIVKQNGKVIFNIYSYNLDKETFLYLKNIKSAFIIFFDNGIEYNEIPKILAKHDVGVILYKPFSINFINNVTNKFYEYYACGIDIWFSKTMKSTYQHINPKTYPRVIPLDFTRLNFFNWQKAIDRTGLKKSKENFYCEDVYKELVEELRS